MSLRSESHPHVRTIMAAIDRAVESEVATGDTNTVAAVASLIVSYGNCAEEFEAFIRPRSQRWTHEGLRAVVLATAMHAPPGDLALLAEQAEKEFAWCEWWDAEGRWEASAVIPLPWQGEQLANLERVTKAVRA